MIITLCGSARFEEWFHTWNRVLSLNGAQVFGLSSYPSQNKGQKDWHTDEQKEILDNVHKNKIDASDAILVLNVFAYIGHSTLREIQVATVLKKTIYFLESWGKGNGVGHCHTDALQKAKAKYIGAAYYGSPIDTFAGPQKRRDPYIGDLLGPAGDYRNALVEYIKQRDLELTGCTE